MLDTLQKMSGTTHRSFTDSKTVTRDKQRLFMQNESKATYTVTTKEVPVISYNDMAFISERNSIVFRAGDSPIWNRNEMILPMSWRLFKDTIIHVGHDYSLQTIPTLSSALDFDVRKNQPDFMEMLNKRIEQSTISESAKQSYQQAYGYTDYEMSQLDPDVLAEEIMGIINEYLREREKAKQAQNEDQFEILYDQDWMGTVEENTEQLQATAEAAAQQRQADQKRYAGGLLSREDLISSTSGINRSLDKDIIESYLEVKGDMWSDTMYFTARDGNFYGVNGQPYIVRTSSSEDLAKLEAAAKDKNSNVYAEGSIDKNNINSLGSYLVTDEFYRFLVSLDQWTFAKGRFDSAMARRMGV